MSPEWAKIQRRRRYDRQNIGRRLAADFAKYIEGRSADQPLWGSSWSDKATETLRRDMEGIEQKTPEGVLTFHSLRHTHITEAVAAAGREGLSTRDVMQHCRLSNENLLNGYNHVQEANQQRLVSAMVMDVEEAGEQWL